MSDTIIVMAAFVFGLCLSVSGGFGLLMAWICDEAQRKNMLLLSIFLGLAVIGVVIMSAALS